MPTWPGTVHIYLTRRQHHALRELAGRTGRSMADLVRETLDPQRVRDALPPTDLGDLAGVVAVGQRTNVVDD